MSQAITFELLGGEDSVKSASFAACIELFLSLTWRVENSLLSPEMF